MQVFHAEPVASRAHVGEITSVVLGVVVTVFLAGLFEGHVAVAHQLCDGVELVLGFLQGFDGHLGGKQDVAAVDGLATTLDELDDMESEFGLHHIRDLAVTEVEGHVLKLGGIHALAGEAELTALSRRARVLGIEHRHGGEAALAVKDALADLIEAVFHHQFLVDADGRALHDLHEFVVGIDHREAVARDVTVEFFDFFGRHHHVFHNLGLHLLLQHVVFGSLTHLVFDFRHALAELGLHLLL